MYFHDYHNDRKHSCGRDGIHSQSKTWIKRAIILEHKCPFYVYVAFDSKGFFVVPGLGDRKYLYHNQQRENKSGIFLNQDIKSQKKTKN